VIVFHLSVPETDCDTDVSTTGINVITTGRNAITYLFTYLLTYLLN